VGGGKGGDLGLFMRTAGRAERACKQQHNATKNKNAGEKKKFKPEKGLEEKSKGNLRKQNTEEIEKNDTRGGPQSRGAGGSDVSVDSFCLWVVCV